jgi:ABC-type polysaccharide/polyol phosphate transport system ATPase subunit
LAAQTETLDALVQASPPSASAKPVPAFSVRGISKTFRIPHHQVSTLKERVLHPFSRSRVDELPALRDVTFDVEQGEFFGVVGRNGSGKSTLLKCLAQIYRPDSGSIEKHGRLSPFIELGVGFNPDLNAKDNVIVNATLMGLPPGEARRRFADVIAFAELEDFVEMKLKNYSSGMQVRLGFATAIQVDAEILLVDEVLAVGDALFQRKCFDTFRRLIDEGRTIIYVSHDLATVNRFADRALLLENGEMVCLDVPEVVTREYEQRNHERAEGQQARARAQGNRVGDGGAEILEAWFENEEGERVLVINQSELATFKFKAVFHREMEGPILGFNIRDEHQNIVLNWNNLWGGKEAGVVRAGETRTFLTTFPNWLGAGFYYATPLVAHPDGQRWADLRDRFVRFEVVAPLPSGALVDLPQETQVLTE